MIRPEQVFLAIEPLDMRWGTDRLSCHAQQLMGRSPSDGTAYAFTNRNRTRLKLLVWDGTGVWLCQRRLHQGRFRWPVLGDTVHRLSQQEWRWLVAGVEWQRLTAKPLENLMV